ncbi:MAG: GIY-YIG nuclease family protein [Verrucomicrobiota bacterium]
MAAFFVHVVDNSYKVYVLENPNGKRYIGLSADVVERLHQHNNGESKWTSRYCPWELVWASDELSLSEARKLENKLKRQGRGSGFYSITGLDRLNLRPLLEEKGISASKDLQTGKSFPAPFR